MRLTNQDLQDHVKAIISGLGFDPNEEGLVDTPERFIKYLKEFNQGEVPIKEIMSSAFPVKDGFHSMVAQSPIPFRMVCEHHLLPAIGTANLGYVPNKTVIGLSKMVRLVQAVGTIRPSLQEIVCDKIADIMEKYLDPKGVIVTIQAEHSCMSCRGINSPGVVTYTSSVRGIFRDVPQARAEFFSLIQIGGK